MRRRLCRPTGTVLCLLVSFAVPPQRGSQTPGSAPLTTIPLEPYLRAQAVVHAVVNGQPGTFLFDTGQGVSSFARLCRENRMPPLGSDQRFPHERGAARQQALRQYYIRSVRTKAARAGRQHGGHNEVSVPTCLLSTAQSASISLPIAPSRSFHAGQLCWRLRRVWTSV